MLPSSRRLTSAEVPKILKEGKGASFGALRLKYIIRGNKAVASRFAVVASKKVLKNAVDRNRLRRRIYAILASTPSPLPIDGVVLVSSGKLVTEALSEGLVSVLSCVR